MLFFLHVIPMEKKTVWPFQIIFFFARDYNKMLLVYPSLMIFGPIDSPLHLNTFQHEILFSLLISQVVSTFFSLWQDLFCYRKRRGYPLWATILGKCASWYQTHNFSFLPGSNFSACTSLFQFTNCLSLF